MPEVGAVEVTQEQLEAALESMGAVRSAPPSEGERRVDNIYITYVEANPRLEIIYEEEE